MGGKMSRTKGCRVERSVIDALNLAYGSNVKRELEQYRSGGLDTTEGLPWAIEIKARKRAPGVQKYLEQAEEAKLPGTVPIAIVKPDRKPATVTLYLRDFLYITDTYVQLWLRNNT